MSATWTAVFTGLALFFFMLGTLGVTVSVNNRPRLVDVNWVALGLAMWVFVAFYNALAAAT